MTHAIVKCVVPQFHTGGIQTKTACFRQTSHRFGDTNLKNTVLTYGNKKLAVSKTKFFFYHHFYAVVFHSQRKYEMLKFVCFGKKVIKELLYLVK